jgi:hypothetical protein
VCGLPHDGPASSPSCGVPAGEPAPPPSALDDALLAVGALAVVASATALVTVALAAGQEPASGPSLGVLTGVAGLVVTTVALVLARLTHSSVTWQMLALLAVQPVPVLLVPPSALDGSAELLGMLGTVLLDVLVLARSRGLLAHVAEVLMRMGAALVATLGPVLAWVETTPGSWTATILLAGAGSMAALLRRDPRLAARLPEGWVLACGSAVVVLALAGSLLRYL